MAAVAAVDLASTAMPAFEFEALSADGALERGVEQADNARALRQMLRGRGLLPLKVEAVLASEPSQATRRGPRLSFKPRLRAAELALITRQLAALLRAGLPVDEALVALADEADRGAVRKILSQVRSRVLEGFALHQALAEFESSFNEVYVSAVAAGEQAGNLELVLERMAEHLDAAEQAARTLGLALIYPALLICVALVIVAGLLRFVVPELSAVFATLGGELPWLTRALLATSELLQSHGLLLLGGLLSLIIGGQLALRDPRLRLWWHRRLLQLPVLGRIWRAQDAGRFARTLAALTGSAVPVLEALKLAARAVGFEPVRQAVNEVLGRVREGAPLARALRETRAFPPLLARLVASGEKSGQLDQMLERAAIEHEREASTRTKTLLALIEPLLILAMGGTVLLIVLAILLPIFDLNQRIG